MGEKKAPPKSPSSLILQTVVLEFCIKISWEHDAHAESWASSPESDFRLREKARNMHSERMLHGMPMQGSGDHASRNSLQNSNRRGAGPGNAIPQKVWLLRALLPGRVQHASLGLSLSITEDVVNQICVSLHIFGDPGLHTHPTGPRLPRLRIWPLGLSLVTDSEGTVQLPGVLRKKGHSTTITVNARHRYPGQMNRSWESMTAKPSSVICSWALGARGPRKARGWHRYQVPG